jgi:hypothetical protein
MDSSFIRVFRMRNVNSTNLAGHVFCFVESAVASGVPDPDSIRAIIQPGNNQTEMAVYTIPAGKTGYMRSWFASTSGSNRSSNYVMRLLARSFGGVFQLKHKTAIADNGTSAYHHIYEEPEVFQAKTDIEMKTTMTANGATSANISAGFDIVLVDE